MTVTKGRKAALTAKRESTVSVGDGFRDEVASLLSAAGMSVTTEVLLGHKKVDVVATTRWFGTDRTLLVECKKYKSTLTLEQVVQIKSDYEAVQGKSKWDEIWIICNRDCSAAAKNYIASFPFLKFMTFVALKNSIMDFSKYASAIIDDFVANDLNENYLSLKNEKGVDLVTALIEWINDDSSYEPTAVLAGYGKGKTSLAKRLAHDLARNWQSNPNTGRIPILVPLGDISSEQSIEGLLGKLFSSTAIVSGYSFSLFQKLNSDGRFVVIFDGFDEMKHAISWEQFCFNFQQINKLVGERAKVVVLGRPSAFLSEDEYNWVLRGVRRQSDQLIRISGAPTYREMSIAELSSDDSYLLVERYASFFRRKRGQNPISVSARISELQGHKIDDLISRPVHARMVAELVADDAVTIKRFSAFDIYDLFIKLTIEREMLKAPRQRFNGEQRRLFARKLAWFLWCNSNSINLNTSAIPEKIFLGIIPPDDPDSENLRRDLIAACFLERKNEGVLYFPHRSFQEFLVAEYLVEHELEMPEFRFASDNLNDEIARFVALNPARSKLSSRDRLISAYEGQLSLLLLQALASGRDIHDRTRLSGLRGGVVISCWTILLDHLSLPAQPDRTLVAVYVEYMKGIYRTVDQKTRSACLISLILLTGQLDESFRDDLVEDIAVVILEHASFPRFVNLLKAGKAAGMRYMRGSDSWETYLFVRTFHFNGGEIEIDLITLENEAIATLGKSYQVPNLDVLPIRPVGRVDLARMKDRLREVRPNQAALFAEFCDHNGTPSGISIG